MKVCVSQVFTGHLQGLEIPPDVARKMRRADDFIRLGVVAGWHTLQPVVAVRSHDAERCGLIIGTAFGTMETNFDVLELITSGESASPTLFSHSVFNAAAGYMASILDLKGCALTITDFSFPFFRALQQGYLSIISGGLDNCLVLQVETYSALLQDAKAMYAASPHDWPPGAVCWMLERTESVADGKHVVDAMSIEPGNRKTQSYLSCLERLVVNGEGGDCADPLAGARSITRKLQNAGPDSRLDIRVEAPHGTVQLSLMA